MATEMETKKFKSKSGNEGGWREEGEPLVEFPREVRQVSGPVDGPSPAGRAARGKPPTVRHGGQLQHRVQRALEVGQLFCGHRRGGWHSRDAGVSDPVQHDPRPRARPAPAVLSRK